MALRQTYTIPLEIKQSIRRDFILGRGTRVSLAKTYGVSPKVVLIWAASEKWEDIRSRFQRDDELIQVKLQITDINDQLSRKRLKIIDRVRLWQTKEMAINTYFRLTLHPRSPIGKIMKDNSARKIAALLQSEVESEVESYTSIKETQAVVVPTDPFSEVGVVDDNTVY